MSIKISYTNYKDYPEATDISKSTGIISFFLYLIGFITGIFIMIGGSWKIILGLLVMAGTGLLDRLFIVSSKRQIADITDPVINAIKNSGIDVSKQYKLRYNKNPFSLEDHVFLRVVIDRTNNLFCFAYPGNSIHVVPFNELFYFAALQDTTIIGELGVKQKSSVITTIEYRKAELAQSKEVPVDLGIATAKTPKPIPFQIDCDPTITVKFYNTLVDEIKDALEEYSGVKPTPKPIKVTTPKNNIANVNNIQEQPNTTPNNNTNSAGIPEQIKQLKQLADEGVITKEEFEEKKKELLKRI